MKTATEILFEYGIDIMKMDDDFNCQLLFAMERYSEQFKQSTSDGRARNKAECIINYIESNAEILIPFDELIGKDGGSITQKEYGLVLLRYLASELREKFIPVEDKKK